MGELDHLGAVGIARAKAALRAEILHRRAARPAAQRTALASQIRARVMSLCAERGVRTVAAYAAIDTEPDTAPLLDALLDAGIQVLLPAVADRELDWARYEGELVAARWGLSEPPGPRFGAAALRTAGLVVVPALAVDRAGTRLGRGGGYYDRALAMVDESLTVAPVWADEFRDALPVEPHDRRIHAVVTEERFVRLVAPPH